MHWDNWCFHTHSSLRVIVPLVVFCVLSPGLTFLLGFLFLFVGLPVLLLEESRTAKPNCCVCRCWHKSTDQTVRLGRDETWLSVWATQEQWRGRTQTLLTQFPTEMTPTPHPRWRPLVPWKLFVHREGKKKVKSRSGNAVRTWERAALESWL